MHISDHSHLHYTMKNWTVRAGGILALCLWAMGAGAQLYPQPQPLMFDRGYDQYAPPPGTQRMTLSRYIPGARFPKDYDVVVETYDYDPNGKLVGWKRFQNITGDLTLQTDYTWAPEGHLLKERIFIPHDRSEVIRSYVWEKDANGKFTKATFHDKNSKPMGTVEVLPDGNTVITETSLGDGKYVRSTFGPNQRLLKMENTSMGQTEVYTYYPDGTVKQLDISSSKGVAQVKYENKVDGKGRVVEQTETGKTAPRIFFFTYNDRGQLMDKANVPKQPVETRGYDTLGRLTDVLTYDAQGIPKEVLNISYARYRN